MVYKLNPLGEWMVHLVHHETPKTSMKIKSGYEARLSGPNIVKNCRRRNLKKWGEIELTTLFLRPHRLAWPRTPPFHGGDGGSNPPGDATSSLTTPNFHI